MGPSLTSGGVESSFAAKNSYWERRLGNNVHWTLLYLKPRCSALAERVHSELSSAEDDQIS
ncbi:hypothetical protein ACPUYX_12245 [Desulfosporosinus sp. SYSU MS00001]|uniref:hypothetical protein n=1 Tax=Desulfosporosinus sp. SYSU MS00001 TaxID=3416284 RepID=UPI003CF26C62